MLKFTQNVRQHLINFSVFIQSQETDRSEHEPVTAVEKLVEARDRWLKIPCDDIDTQIFKHYLLKPINAGAGGSGFLSPEPIEKAVQKLDAVDWVDYESHLPDDAFVKSLEKFCKEESLIQPEQKIYGNCYDKSLDNNSLCAVLGNGSHHLFNIAVKTLCQHPDDLIVVTSPTYGLLLTPIAANGGSIHAIALDQENGFQLEPKKLAAEIKQKNQSLKDTYYQDCEVLFPLIEKLIQHQDNATWKKLIQQFQLTRNKSYETADRAVAALNQLIALQSGFQSASKQLQSIYTLKPCPRTRGFFNINPHTPVGTVLTQRQINDIADQLSAIEDLCIIDDLSHRGIALKDVQPGSFSRSNMSERTITLLSMSKTFSLAGLRAGVCIAPKYIAEKMNGILFDSVNMVSVVVPIVLKAVMDLPRAKYQKHLGETNAEYRFRLELVRAMVYGIDEVKDESMREKITQSIKKSKMKSSLKSICTKGIPQLQFANEPEGAYFVQLDFSAYQGKYLGNTKLKSGLDFSNAFNYLADLETIPSELNYEFNKPILRFTITMEPDEIIEALLRIKGILSLTKQTALSAEQSASAKKQSQVEPAVISLEKLYTPLRTQQQKAQHATSAQSKASSAPSSSVRKKSEIKESIAKRTRSKEKLPDKRKPKPNPKYL